MKRSRIRNSGLGLTAVLALGAAMAAAAQAQTPAWQAKPGSQPMRLAARDASPMQLSDEPMIQMQEGPGTIILDEPPCGPGCSGCDSCAGGCREGYGYWNSPASDRGYWCVPNWAGILGPLYFRGDYLLWWTSGLYAPPLVTAAAGDGGGLLGEADTAILFGDEELHEGSHSGGRFVLGYWFDPCKWSGLEVSIISLGEDSTSRSFDGDNYNAFGRPFFNVLEGEWEKLPDHDLLITTNESVAVEAQTEFDLLDLTLRRALINRPCHRLDLLLGYRTAKLDEDLWIGQTFTVGEPMDPFETGSVVDLEDYFDVDNRFSGVNLGVAGRIRKRCWTLEMEMKLGLGNTHTNVTIYGDGQQTDPGVDGGDPTITDYAGGMLALPSNIGEYESNSFSVVPELGVTLAYDLTCRLRATLGYRLIYWSKVARPGDQIDLDIDADQFFQTDADDEDLRPEFSLVTTDFWAQGLNLGLEWRY